MSANKSLEMVVGWFTIFFVFMAQVYPTGFCYCQASMTGIADDKCSEFIFEGDMRQGQVGKEVHG